MAIGSDFPTHKIKFNIFNMVEVTFHKLHPQVPSPKDDLRLMLGSAMKMLNHHLPAQQGQGAGETARAPRSSGNSERQVCRVG